MEKPEPFPIHRLHHPCDFASYVEELGLTHFVEIAETR